MGFIDDAISTLKDVFNGGPANWQERLAGEIILLSPEGSEYHGKWRGSSRSMAKKLGVLKHPKIKGDIVQDMEVASMLWPLTFYFDGANHDKEAAAFMQSCKERGQWTITHPVHGYVGLQLISVEEKNEPVEGGNITEIITEWIEPIDPLTLKTARELAGIIDAQQKALDVSAAQQFANNIQAASEGLRGAIENTTAGIARVTKYLLGPLFTTVDALEIAENAIQNGIQDTHNATVLQVESLVGQIQNLIDIPLFSSDSLNERKAAYASLAGAFLDMLPSGPERTVRSTASDAERRNALATCELALTAALGSSCKVVITSLITPRGLGSDDTGALATRAQAVQAATDLSDLLDTVIDAVEDEADYFSGGRIDEQYYAFGESYADLSILVHQTIEYLLGSALDLAIERRFTLDRPRAPIEIAISEYGSLGEDDRNLDLFIRSNELQGPDILLLPAGREVVIYA